MVVQLYNVSDLELSKGKSLVEFGSLAAWVVFDSESQSVKKVLLDKCAHMGSKLKALNRGFLCTTHNWSYGEDGSNETLENPSLSELAFEQDAGALTIYWPEAMEILPEPRGQLNGSETLELISHATYYLKADDQRMLFDPWIEGDTYWGSWSLFPNYGFDISQMEAPTAIIITHPHPDHFHPQTLRHFQRDTPVYLPPFPSEIMPKILNRMGFTNIQEIPWETPLILSDKTSFSFLRPNTVWEDAAVLVRVANWTWLNQNDAGTPLKDEAVPTNIDLLSSTFDDGASGYPLTWAMAENKRSAIMSNSRKQILHSILERCSQTRAKHFSPFAGWWRHSFADHQIYARQLDHITMSDLDIALESIETNFIPSIPSTKIKLKDMSFTQSPEAVEALARQPFTKKQPQESSMPDQVLVDAIRSKLAALSAMSYATDCENVTFAVSISGLETQIQQRFGQPGEEPVVSILVNLERWVAELYAAGDESVTWNHLDIGYLGSWSREPDLYPVKFMRLLSLGYIESQATERIHAENVGQISVAQLIESDPTNMSRVLSRAGLPCISCKMTNYETLDQAMEIHRLGVPQRKSLEHEVAAVYSSGLQAC